jgi:hypothetical protein
MNGHNDIHVPDCPEFVRGYQIYNQRENHGPLWFVAQRIAQDNWSDSRRMSEVVGVIIRGWNRFFAGYDADALTTIVTSNLNTLSALRYRDISSYRLDDKSAILELFEAFGEIHET